MPIILAALSVILGGGFLALLSTKRPRLCTFFAVAGTVAGSLMGLVPAWRVLSGGTVASIRLPLSIPYGSFYLVLDPLAALFLLPIFVLSSVAAIYGWEYLAQYRGKKWLGPPWFFYNLLVAGMAMVVLARNSMLFLISWEVMSVASFFLVTFEDEEKGVREAGWTYLVATHLGTAFLIAFFVLLGRQTGSMDFDHAGSIAPAMAGVLFLLAVIGFGTKAGFMPLHVWLPEAHPAAPSHVSALMSGVMIKTGIYGLVRALTLLGPPAEWWCWVLIGIGVSSGVLGVLFALAQHDLKRLLAYSSVENIGIIALGLGVGLLGVRTGSASLAVLGFAGGLLHVVNHGLFKGLLFLGAGAVLHGTGTRQIDRLGGLFKRMPWTGLVFLTGAAAICGLPPLNGFVSEFLIYLGVLRSGLTGVQGLAPALAVMGGLAVIGGLAAACFAKAFGAVFLGEPRIASAEHIHEAGPGMRFAMLLLALGCVLVGLLSPAIVRAGVSVVGQVTGMKLSVVQTEISGVVGVLWSVVQVGVLFLGVAVAIAVFRRRLLAGRSVAAAGTWDCGYARPTARMQYTGSSFAQPLTFLFRMFLRTRARLAEPKDLFPDRASLHTDTPDASRRFVFHPAFSGLEVFLARLHWLQHGRVQMYVLYIALTLWILLMWKLR